MVAENPTWGAPRIHGELLMLGFDLSEPTVSRWVRKAPRPPDLSKRWLTFLRNDRGDGLLHGADAKLWRALLLVRDRPRPTAHLALQRDPKPQCPVDYAAAA